MNNYNLRNTRCVAGRFIVVLVFVSSPCIYFNGVIAQDLGWNITQPISEGSISAFSSSVGGTILAGATLSQLYKSMDDGLSCTKFVIDESNLEPISAIELRDDGFAMAGTKWGKLYRSFYGAETWAQLIMNNPE